MKKIEIQRRNGLNPNYKPAPFEWPEHEECHVEQQYLELWSKIKVPVMFIACVIIISSWAVAI